MASSVSTESRARNVHVALLSREPLFVTVTTMLWVLSP